MYICSYALRATKCSIHKWTQYISSQRHLSCKNATRLTDCWYMPMACLQVLWFNLTQSSVCQVVCDPVICIGKCSCNGLSVGCEIMLHSAICLASLYIDCTVQWLQWLAIDPRGAGLIPAATFQWRWNVYVMPVHVKKPQMLKFLEPYITLKPQLLLLLASHECGRKSHYEKDSRLEEKIQNHFFFFLVFPRSQTCILFAFNRN